MFGWRKRIGYIAPTVIEVVAYEFYTQSFRAQNAGLGAALAVILFILVIPIIVYNVRQLRLSEEIR